jgi:hypothetical protein
VKDFLPHGEKDEGKEITAEDLRGTVQSPQFQQVKSRLGYRYRTLWAGGFGSALFFADFEPVGSGSRF